MAISDLINNIKPLGVNTCLQDCSLITQTFEKSAHADPTEAAVFAVLSRELENTKIFSQSAQLALDSYIQVPQVTAAENDTTQSDAIEDVSSAQGVANNSGSSEIDTDSFLRAIISGNKEAAAFVSQFKDTTLSKLKECIPCDLRMVSFTEMFPSADILATMKADVLARLQVLDGIKDMLKNYDLYGDFCELVNLLSSMCIQDLQRIIMLLMSLLMLDLPQFDIFIGMIRAMIAPIFAPVLMAITALMDMVTLNILSPVECIIDAINMQLQKVNRKLNSNNSLYELKGGLSELLQSIQDGKAAIQERLSFYYSQLDKLTGELGVNGDGYVKLSMKKLKILRLVNFIRAIIQAMTTGQLSCGKEGRSANRDELDNFFTNFLNPNIPYNISIDQNGIIRIDDIFPDNRDPRPSFDKEAEPPIIDEPNNINQIIQNLQGELLTPVEIEIPCKLETTPGESSKINEWIAELNKVGL